jgi:hypothetical protein
MRASRSSSPSIRGSSRVVTGPMSPEADRERALAAAGTAEEEGAPSSVVDAALGADALLVGVLDLGHLGDRVGDLDELGRCVATGDDDVDVFGRLR